MCLSVSHIGDSLSGSHPTQLMAPWVNLDLRDTMKIVPLASSKGTGNQVGSGRI